MCLLHGGIVITGGLHDGQADFGGISVVVDGTYDSDSFVATFSDASEVRWVRLSHGGSGVATDTSGNIYSVGTSWIAGEDPGFGLHCTKFSPSGDLLWERRIPGVTGERITLDGLQNPVISAVLYIDAQLDDHFVPYNGYDGSGNYAPEALLCKVDATGRFQWAITASGAYASSENMQTLAQGFAPFNLSVEDFHRFMQLVRDARQAFRTRGLEFQHIFSSRRKEMPGAGSS